MFPVSKKVVGFGVLSMLGCGVGFGQTLTFRGSDAVSLSSSGIFVYPNPPGSPIVIELEDKGGLLNAAPPTNVSDVVPIRQIVAGSVSAVAIGQNTEGGVGGDLSGPWADLVQATAGVPSPVSSSDSGRFVRTGFVEDVPVLLMANAVFMSTGTPPMTVIAVTLANATTQYEYSFVPNSPYNGGGIGSGSSLPNGAGQTLVFTTSNAGTVTVQGSAVNGNVVISSSSPYSLSGGGSLSLDTGAGGARAQISIDGNASHVISAPLNFASNANVHLDGTSRLTITGAISGLQGKSLSKSGAGTLTLPAMSVGTLQIIEGTVQINNSGAVTRLSTLALSREAKDGTLVLATEGVLDIKVAGSGLIQDYDTGVSPIGRYDWEYSIARLIKNGYNGGSWQGSVTGSDGIKDPRITSSAAASDTRLRIGFGEASTILGSGGGTFLGQSVDGTTALVRVVFGGDANLSGSVNLDDFSVLAGNFGKTNAIWSDGDFNYDGVVNLDDQTILSANFGNSVTVPSSLPRSSVPEPTSTLAMCVIAALTTRVTRRRCAMFN